MSDTCDGVPIDGGFGNPQHCDGCARISTLEARIADLERERGAVGAALKEAVATNDEMRAELHDVTASLRRQAKEAECFECHRRCKWFDEQGAPWDRARSVGVRCADCGYVLCRDCAPKHFGNEYQQWRDGHARLQKLFDDAGEGQYNVLALVDHYQNSAIEAQRDSLAARSDRDEAVRLLREAPGSAIENDWERQRRAYLALHPAQPETPNAPPKNGETE